MVVNITHFIVVCNLKINFPCPIAFMKKVNIVYSFSFLVSTFLIVDAIGFAQNQVARVHVAPNVLNYV